MMFKPMIFIFLTIASTTLFNTLPSVDVKTFEGESINIKDYTSNGKIQLVSLWATWCGPCKVELNALQKVEADWKEKYDVEIIAITLDNARSLKRAEALAKKQSWPYTFFTDAEGVLAGNLGVRGIPYSMLIDQSGNIISTSEGYYQGYEAEMEKKIIAIAK